MLVAALTPGRAGAAPLARQGRILNRMVRRCFCRLLRGVARRRCARRSRAEDVEITGFWIFLPALQERASIRENAFLCAADCGGSQVGAGAMAARVRGAARGAARVLVAAPPVRQGRRPRLWRGMEGF